MIELNYLISAIQKKVTETPPERSLLVAISGIDGSGKGYVSQQLRARLTQCSISTALINIDGWLNLPDRRFNPSDPAKHFYKNAIRFGDLFTQLILPLRDQRSIMLAADFAEETATSYRKHIYKFENVDVILLEGIFLFKQEFKEIYDMTVWIDCTFWTALSRALQRKQEGLPPAETVRAYETIYFAAQHIHLERDKPRDVADVIITNDPFLEIPAPASFNPVSSEAVSRLTA